MAKRALLLFLFIFTSIAVFGNELRGPFFYDDVVAVEHNKFLQSFQGWKPISKLQIDSNQELDGAFRPFFMGILWAISQIFGVHAWLFRLISILLHAACAALLYLYGRRFFQLERNWALAATFVFLLHPIHTTHMALIWKQADLWVALAALGGLWILGRIEKRPAIYSAALIAVFMTALGVKESALVLPLIWLVHVPLLPNVARKTAVILNSTFLLASMATYFLVFPKIPSPNFADTNPATRWEYFTTQLEVFALYFRALLFPSYLSFDRAIPLPTLSPVVCFMWLTVCVGAVSWLAFWASLKRSAWACACLSAIFWWIPTSSFQTLALFYDETRLYLGFGFLVCTATYVLKRIQHRFVLSRSLKRIGLVLFLGTLAISSLLQGSRFSSERRLWESVLDTDSENPRALQNLGSISLSESALDEAEDYFHRALRRNPNFYEAHLMLGLSQGRRGDLLAADESFARLLKGPRHWKALGHYHLGLSQMYRHNSLGARAHFEEAEKANPSAQLGAKGAELLKKYELSRK